MADILPAILAKSAEEMREKFALVPDGVATVHVDVLEEDVCADFSKPFEAHLMVKDPEAIMERWMKRGAKAIIVHTLTDKILEYKGKTLIGLGVEMNKPLEEVYPLVQSVDFVHLMSIAEMGAQGRPFDDRVFDRIRAVKDRFPFKTISVDGGINEESGAKLIEYGVDKLVVGLEFIDVWTSLMKRS